ncbi:septal ring lytic transglycosylase RlpA family protein [Carboxylicivirga taeanensis]|uniref:septal ring lytic transglycosylase RlpA family protein n=1 Tax=Carboxylicivirga taeanensis TaxID=1416875 RepID=UPI003F6DD5FF
MLSALSGLAQEIYQTGKASFYASHFDGRLTASGERFSNQQMTAAHRTLPFGTKLRVTNLSNQKSVIVTINDRGPFIKGRIIDVSQKAARALGFYQQGIATVRIESLRHPLPPDSLAQPLQYLRPKNKPVAYPKKHLP